jgi:N-acetylglutamate synthase-like GNAT family acetyltransferase
VTALPLARDLTVATRAAVPRDIPGMVGLMKPYIASGDLLPRTAGDLERDIARYVVACERDGRLLGMGALKPYADGLAEVIALAVHADAQGRGVGQMIVERLVGRAAELGFGEVFALTRVPGFFHKLGYVTVEKGRFPLKVWSDCARCARAHCCDETAVHLAGVASRRTPA